MSPARSGRGTTPDFFEMQISRESMTQARPSTGSVPLAAKFWASVRAHIEWFTARRRLHFSMAARCAGRKPNGPGQTYWRSELRPWDSARPENCRSQGQGRSPQGRRGLLVRWCVVSGIPFADRLEPRGAACWRTSAAVPASVVPSGPAGSARLSCRPRAVPCAMRVWHVWSHRRPAAS